MNGLKCEIKSRSVGSTVELTGVVWADQSAHGIYRMTVDKSGPSGRSSVAQQGNFDLGSGRPEILGLVRVNTTEGDRYVARLVVQTESGEEVCAFEF
ncbi:curli-like amyloid fiber formation chaperone CsgH [Citreimonas salinaria]|uniref:CsgH-like domain-containing protein n=1 Tax=Citreimonas salinaria TaxID=321339 RepID=A0A1H3N685_9RHOB|nr:curli-like amyloid fiber formation chaperone CsgH [Citreimonas salinaria]SDY83985.1 hypothetical protein SAMN05444340_12037 [Citreimonas salinaria]